MATSSETPIPGYFSNIHIVLVEPQAPGNIGAAARAMKTMGLSRLTLVNPVEFRAAPETRWLAHGADDVVDAARVVPSLDHALADMRYVVGTANRKRGLSLGPVYPVREAVSELTRVARKYPVALLFGREDRGLLNEELAQCHIITRVPAACAHPSLNLAQAVMVCVYELFQLSGDPPPPVSMPLAGNEDIERICLRINDTLRMVGFVSHPEPDTFLRSIRRIFRQSFRLEMRDVAALHKMCDHIAYYVRTTGKTKSDGTTDT